MIEAIARTLAPAFPESRERAVALAEKLAQRIAHADDPEASLRFQKGELRGGRMLIERSNVETARELAAGLGLRWSRRAGQLCRAVGDLELSLIVGWDATKTGVSYKIYANASDRAQSERIALAERFGLAVGEDMEVPHILGLNVSKRTSALKAYYQRPQPPEAGFPLVEFPPGAVITWLLSCDVHPDGLSPRGLFAAISHEYQAHAERVVTQTIGRPWAFIAECFPFEPGPIRQIGWAPDSSITIYAKAKDTARALHTLEPVAVFSADGVEVGLYLEPSAGAPRAFARTERHALSFRNRHGEPESADLERLGEWAALCVRHAEATGWEPSFVEPPDPWRLKN